MLSGNATPAGMDGLFEIVSRGHPQRPPHPSLPCRQVAKKVAHPSLPGDIGGTCSRQDYWNGGDQPQLTKVMA